MTHRGSSWIVLEHHWLPSIVSLITGKFQSYFFIILQSFTLFLNISTLLLLFFIYVMHVESFEISLCAYEKCQKLVLNLQKTLWSILNNRSRNRNFLPILFLFSHSHSHIRNLLFAFLQLSLWANIEQRHERTVISLTKQKVLYIAHLSFSLPLFHSFEYSFLFWNSLRNPSTGRHLSVDSFRDTFSVLFPQQKV